MRRHGNHALKIRDRVEGAISHAQAQARHRDRHLEQYAGYFPEAERPELVRRIREEGLRLIAPKLVR